MMKLYRALLRLYPASFRAEYGDELCAAHRDRLRDSSVPLLTSIAALFETLWAALAVHLDILKQDLRYAARTLARSPGFALTAIVVAALGIGATTAAFTMIDYVLVRPLPFADQDRIVKLFEDHSFIGVRDFDVSPGTFRDWQQNAKSFESMGAYRSLSVNLIGIGDPKRIIGSGLTAGIFPILGVKPVVGRYFAPEDDRETSQGTAVLSYDLWQNDFAGDPAVLGKKIILDNDAYTVIGVMPATFYFPTRDARIWTAMRFRADAFEDRTDTYIFGVAKLKRGVAIETAAAEMRAIASQIERAHPKEMARVGATVMPIRDDMPNQSRVMLRVLAAASLCVLLVACTNLANLLLARALARRKELTVRAAMGAGRERLVRQMLTESLLLAITGGAIGVLLASLSLPLLVRLVPVYLPIADVPPVDLRVLAFAAIVTIATGVGFGVLPALRVSSDSDTLRERGGTGGRKERLRSALVIAEVAGSVVLLVSCGLLVRALWRIQSVDPGFRSENVLTLRTSLPIPKYEPNPRREQFIERVLSETRQLPGVTGAAYISGLPMVQGGGIWAVEVEGHPQPLSERKTASLRFVTPGYFQTMQIPLVRGRDVADSDRLDSLFTAVVSESFVRRYWPDQDPLGRRFDFGNATRTIVGVVRDVRVRGLERIAEPQVYLPYKQQKNVGFFYAPKDLVIRATVDPASLTPALRRIIRETDAEQPVSDVHLLTDIVSLQTATRRVQLAALGSFAAIAFLLAAIGIHGVLSFAVSNRTQEIGVRMALGAGRGNILSLILRDGVILAALGIAAGVALAFGAATAMRALLAGVEPADPATFASAIALCFTMTLFGSLLPALRAVRVDPVTAIRSE
ncbi:MAG: ABC transporter permease [Acidobacteriia bacterium]|nr:ABC transporter permease [Terriglobia bacterium]